MHEGFGHGVNRIRSGHHGKGGRAEEISNAVNFDCLLRKHANRQHCRCTTETTDELAPPHCCIVAAQTFTGKAPSMSALGQKQTCAAHKLMSALPPKATANAT